MKRNTSLFLCLLCLISFANGSMAENQVHLTPVKIDAGNADRVHLRAEPSTDSASRGLYFTGTEAVSNGNPTGEWTHVVIGSQDGYIMTKYLRWGSDIGYVQSEQLMGVIHTNSWVNIRSAPDKQAEQVGTLRNGETVTILGETDTHWYYVVTTDYIGYVMTDYIEMGGTTGTPSNPSTSMPGNSYTPNVLDLFKPVMSNTAAFFSVSDNRSMYLGELSFNVQDTVLTFTQFTLIDIDSDGEKEVVLKLTVGGNEYGHEIFDCRNGQVYGYTLSNRALQDVRIDGSFSYSSGVADSGIGFMAFSNNGYTVRPIAYSESTGSGSINYYSHGMATTEAVFLQLLADQQSKRAASWQDYTETNVSNIFGR